MVLVAAEYRQLDAQKCEQVVEMIPGGKVKNGKCVQPCGILTLMFERQPAHLC